MTSRERFEAWVEDEFGETFSDPATKLAFAAWQAAERATAIGCGAVCMDKAAALALKNAKEGMGAIKCADAIHRKYGLEDTP